MKIKNKTFLYNIFINRDKSKLYIIKSIDRFNIKNNWKKRGYNYEQRFFDIAGNNRLYSNI